MLNQNKEPKSGKSRSRGIGLPDVVDIQSAQKYNALIMKLLVKGKIASEIVKQLYNSLQMFLLLRKTGQEEIEIRQIIEFGVEKIKNEVTLRLEKFYEVISSIVSKEQSEIITTEIIRTEKEINSLITSGKKEIEENIKKRTPYQLTEKFADIPENISVNVISAMKVLPDYEFQKVIEDPKIKKRIQTLLFGHRN